MSRVLVLGSYGGFGGHIAWRLAKADRSRMSEEAVRQQEVRLT
jgi:uncharacterized protein YbjT (DUF2867 family)